MTTKEYNQIVDEHADALYRFALKLCKNGQAADDLVQESFTRLWQKVNDVDAGKGKSYLFQTAYNYFIDTTRKDKRISGEEVENYEMGSSSSQYTGLSEILENALNTLPDAQKSVVMLRDYEGYSYDEIAEICGLSESQVKVYIFRARKALRSYIVKMENVI